MAYKFLSTILGIDANFTGNVGVGTTTPTNKLDVIGTSYFSTDMYVGQNHGIFFNGNGGYAMGLFSSGSDLLFQGGSVERMRLTSAGNLGLGTTNPQSELDIYRASNPTILLRDSSAIARLLPYAGNVYFQTAQAFSGGSTADLYFTGMYGTPVNMLIKSTGNVLIGTTTDAGYKLQVNGSTTSGYANQSALLVTASGTASTQNAIAIQQLTSEGDTTIFADYEPYAEYGITAKNSSDSIDFTGGTAVNYLDSYNITNRSGNARTAYVKARIGLASGVTWFGGNVGIGTSSPGYRLTVDGGDIYFNSANASASYYLRLNHNNSYDGGILLTRDVSTYDWQMNNSAGTGDFIMYSYGIGNVALTLKRASGNLLIGTTTDAGYKLDVNGTGRFSGNLTLTNSGNIGMYLSRGLSTSSNSIIWQTASTFDWFLGSSPLGTSTSDLSLYSYGTSSIVLNIARSTGVFTLSSLSGSGTRMVVADGSGTLSTQSIPTGTVTGSGTTNYVSKWSSSSSLSNSLLYDNGTNVGIGNTSPSYKLDVNGNVAIPSNNFFRYDGDTGIIGSATSISGGNASQLGIRSATDILFGTNGSNERMRITSAGNVAINTDSPFSVSILTLKESAFLPFSLSMINRNSTHNWAFAVDTNAVDDGNFGIYNVSSSSFPFIITPGGNVLIGTTTNAGYKLDVNGDIRTQTGYIRGANSDADIRLDGTVGSQLRYGGQKVLLNSADAYIYTANTPRIIVNNAGNVGIGTTSPSSKVHSYSTDAYVGTQGITSQSDTNVITLGAGSSGSSPYDTNYMGVYESGLLSSRSMRFSIYGAGGSYFKWSNNGNEQMRITSDGNVGIGTASPTAKLTVVGEGTGLALIGDPGFVGTNYTAISLNNTLSPSSYNFLSSPTDATLYINRPSGLAIRFREANGTDQMIIQSGGNVGIGISNPGVKFVNSGATAASGPTLGSGTIGSQALLSANGLYGMYSGVSTSGDVWHQVQRNDGNTAVYNLLLQPSGGRVGIGTSSANAVLTVVGASLNTYLAIDNASSGENYFGANNFHVFQTAGAERMRITSSGQVGINNSVVYHGANLSVANKIFLSFQPNADIGGTIYGYYDTSLGGYYGGLKFQNFQFNGSSYVMSDAMTINGIGNVGIGTTSPAQKLDVNGLIRTNRTSNTDGGVVFGTVGTYLYGADSGGYLATYTSNTERMRIASNGVATINNLGGSGTRMVVADASGTLSTQAIPGGGAIKAYGSWQSNNTQLSPANNFPTPVIYDVVNFNNNISVDLDFASQYTLITMLVDGVFNIQFSFQFRNLSSSDQDVYIWFRKNGQTQSDDIANSNTLVSVPAKHGSGTPGHTVAAWNFFVQATANDYYQIVWATSDKTNVSMEYIPPTPFGPGSPSSILTVNKVD